MTPELERIITLEQQAETLRESVGRVEHTVNGIAEALVSLVRIEERQIAINIRLAEGANTMKDHGELIRDLEMAIPKKLTERLVEIETKMPGLIESRRWVVAGVLFGLAMMGGSIGHTIFK